MEIYRPRFFRTTRKIDNKCSFRFQHDNGRRKNNFQMSLPKKQKGEHRKGVKPAKSGVVLVICIRIEAAFEFSPVYEPLFKLVLNNLVEEAQEIDGKCAVTRKIPSRVVIFPSQIQFSSFECILLAIFVGKRVSKSDSEIIDSIQFESEEKTVFRSF